MGENAKRNTARRMRCLLAWIAMLFWMAVIFWFSAQSAKDSSEISGGLIRRVIETVVPGFSDMTEEEQTAIVSSWQTAVRKTAHIAEYALLGVLSWITMGFHFSHFRRRVGVAAGIGLLYAITDEVHQIFVPDRGPGVLDVVIDFAGVCIGIAVAAVITHWWQKRKAK